MPPFPALRRKALMKPKVVRPSKIAANWPCTSHFMAIKGLKQPIWTVIAGSEVGRVKSTMLSVTFKCYQKASSIVKK